MEESWREAIEAVAYELARRNGESPLDRGAALRGAWRRWRAKDGLPRAFERLAQERGYRGEESGEESAARVYALVYGVAPDAYAGGRLMTGLAVTPISTTEAVVVSLREKILDGAIAPGAPLPEADLTREFGVARPTVRAAIQTLCHEGLLKRERNRSAFVPRARRTTTSATCSASGSRSSA